MSQHYPLLLAGMIFSLVCGCSGTTPHPSAGNGDPITVRAHLASRPPSLAMVVKPDRSTEIFAFQVTDSLVQWDADLELQPRVAKSWEFSEDHRTLTFRLRDGVRWHDGQPVTADDVVFTLEAVRDPKLDNRSFGGPLRDIESVEAPDSSTVVVRFKETNPDILEAFRVPLVPRHLAGRDENLLEGEFRDHPIGCGPFRYVREDRDERIVLEANDDYWDGRPNIDRLVLAIYPDQNSAYQALRAGDLDIMVVSSNIWAESQRLPESERPASFTYHPLSVWHLAWNMDGSNPFFTDPRVRRAMILALDRQPFIDTVLRGLARRGATTFHPDHPYAAPDVEPWPYDPDEAARLLDAAGWIDRDGDGIRERDGQPFEFSLLIPTSKQKVTEKMAAWKAESWARLGVRATIEQLEFQAYRERRFNRQFQVSAANFHFSPSPGDAYELYHSSSTVQGFNLGALSDPEIDRLTTEGRDTYDVARRKLVYQQLQRRLHELEPITCLFHFATPVLHDPRLLGVTATAIDYMRTTEGPRRWNWAE